MPKPAGVSFNRYVAIAGRAMRRALKEDQRVAAEKGDNLEVRVSRWKNGKQGEPEKLELGLKGSASQSA